MEKLLADALIFRINTCEHTPKPGDAAPIGQERAADALRFGLASQEDGHNIFVCGPAGVGRKTFAMHYAHLHASQMPPAADICYVHNFKHQDRPNLLTLPPGRACELKAMLEDTLHRLAHDLSQFAQSPEYERKKEHIEAPFKQASEAIWAMLYDAAAIEGLAPKQTQSGLIFLPKIDERPITEDEFEELSEADKMDARKKSDQMRLRFSHEICALHTIQSATKRRVDEVCFGTGLFIVGTHMHEIFEAFAQQQDVLTWLCAIKEDILLNLSEFWSDSPGSDSEKNPLDQEKYCINILNKDGGASCAPVVLENSPSHSSLVGEMEFDSEYGNLYTDFTKIRPGVLHKANGGFLVLYAQDLLNNVAAWEALKRTLLTKSITTEPARDYSNALPMATIRPKPIPASIKVVLIGCEEHYHALDYFDEHFLQLFKVRADFDVQMCQSSEVVCQVLQQMQDFSEVSGMDLPRTAQEAVFRFLAREAGHSRKLSAQLGLVRELLAESADIARRAGASQCTREHVAAAEAARVRRLDLHHARLLEQIDEDKVMISTRGECVGQINALTVIDTGDYMFGLPARITAVVYMGKAGIVNIEKEARLSGPVHDKGIQVLTGFLGQTYAQDFALALSCRICFEQNYDGIDGDSASLAELLAVLSALSGLPVRQDIAITGSINQHGLVQPVGGVTQKIEGFFKICETRGLSGTQGVVIPARNKADLVLSDDVIVAVSTGQFHIYAAEHVDEVMELILGKSPGQMPYRPDTVHGRAIERLRGYHIRAFKEACE